jgi:hypothetical protein
MNIKHLIIAPRVGYGGSTVDLHQRGVAEANAQAVDRRTRKHLLREARKANRRQQQQLRGKR